MQITTHRILSIVPGTRYLGIAILEGTSLKEWLVKSIRNTTPSERINCLKSIYETYIEQHEITAVVVKKLHPARSSQTLNNLVAVIKEIGKRSNITIMEFSIEQIKQFLFHRKANKKQLIEEITTTYPFLFHELERERKNKNRYFTRMFEAVALGTMCFHYLDTKQRKVERVKS